MCVPSLKGYYTGQALTRGIKEMTVEVDEHGEIAPQYYLTMGRDFFVTPEEAEARAREMAEKSAASLRRSLARVESMALQPKWLRTKHKKGTP